LLTGPQVDRRGNTNCASVFTVRLYFSLSCNFFSYVVLAGLKRKIAVPFLNAVQSFSIKTQSHVKQKMLSLQHEPLAGSEIEVIKS